MHKLISTLIISVGIFSCTSKDKTATDLYQEIEKNEVMVKNFNGHSIFKRGVFYVFDQEKAVYFVDDFEINKDHQIKLVKSPRASKEKEKEIYLLLEFIVEHEIPTVNSYGEYIEFRTRSQEVLVYFNDPDYMDKFKASEKSFKKIDKKWGHYLGKPLS
ncbi:hypothetical protein [Dyadobacter frigoris]|uniref:hypothetical protein n=1 Tax=Dyadobacter frigoris TaxID=2576211 RepID=UPI0025562D40|nr:hypothetical protein [Dyadobacter frigoris]